MARISRLKKEMELLTKEPPPGVTVWSDDSNLNDLSAQIIGPEDSPFSGGIFSLSITIPERYPFEPPRVRFQSPTIPYHPNIDNEGRICLDTLKSQPQGSWAPSVNISTLLLSIRLLMGNPNAEDGLMPDITEEYKYNRSLWHRKALAKTKEFSSAMKESSRINEDKRVLDDIPSSGIDSVVVAKNDSNLSSNPSDDDDDDDDSDNDQPSDDDENKEIKAVGQKRKLPY